MGIITSQHSSVSMLFFLPLSYLAGDLGLDEARVRDIVLRELSELVRYDEETEEILVFDGVNDQTGVYTSMHENDKSRRTSVIKSLSTAESEALLSIWLELHAKTFNISRSDLARSVPKRPGPDPLPLSGGEGVREGGGEGVREGGGEGVTPSSSSSSSSEQEQFTSGVPEIAARAALGGAARRARGGEPVAIRDLMVEAASVPTVRASLDDCDKNRAQWRQAAQAERASQRAAVP